MMMLSEEAAFAVTKERLGEILVRRRVVGMAQVSQALKVQHRDHRLFGEILTQLGYANERDIIAAVAIQNHVPYIAIDKYTVVPQVLRLIPLDMARRHCVIPLDRVGTILSVVMADPLNAMMKKEVQDVTGCMIVSFISTREEINRAIDQYTNAWE